MMRSTAAMHTIFQSILDPSARRAAGPDPSARRAAGPDPRCAPSPYIQYLVNSSQYISQRSNTLNDSTTIHTILVPVRQ